MRKQVSYPYEIVKGIMISLTKHEIPEIGRAEANCYSEPRIKYELDMETRVIVREFRYYGNAVVPEKHLQH